MLTELISRHKTIGHQILDLEAELGIGTEPQKETLDRLIEEARAKIQVKDIYTREDAVNILSTIDDILRENYKIKADSSAQLLSLGLQKKVLDCDNASFIYLSITDALRLPLAAVSAPKHIFVRFMLNDGSYVNWETTSAKVLSDNYYKQLLNIADAAIENGVFLKNLTRDGIIAAAYNNRGIVWSKRGNLEKAIADYNEAIRLYPNYAAAYNNRGIARLSKLDLLGAYADFIRATFPVFRRN